VWAVGLRAYTNPYIFFPLTSSLAPASPPSRLQAKDVFSYEYGHTHPRTALVMRNLSRVRQRRMDFTIKFKPPQPTPCPAVLAGDGKKKKKGKKGGKKGGKGKKKK
jgi:hypothetical protein